MSSLYHLMADVMAACYGATHNYALAIALLTLATVAITTPLTWKSSRGMIAMQVLQPEMKKLQAKYKGDRVALNEEMSKLYKEQGINPLGGCLPLVPQMVVFYVLYHTIANLSHRTVFKAHAAALAACPAPAHAVAQITQAAGKFSCSDPQNLSVHTLLYRNLVAAGGHMRVFGFDLSTGVTSAHGSGVIGCWILVILVVGAQYFQTRQVNARNPGASANPQAQMMQRIFPLFFGFISFKIQAGVNVYFLVSALCRIGQQSLMFRYDPVLKRQVAAARSGKPVDLPPRSSRPAPGGTGAPSEGPSRGGALARLLGLADGGSSLTGRSGGTPRGPKNLDRFLGGKNATGGSLSNGQPKKPSANGSSANDSSTNGCSPNGSSTNGSSANARGPTGSRPGPNRGPGGRSDPGQPPRTNDRNRSRAKRNRRAR